MKKIILSAVTGLALMVSTAYADVAIGVVNVEKIFNDLPSVQSQKTKMQADYKNKSAQLQTEQDKLQKLVDQYKKNEAVMTQSQKQDLQTQIGAQQNKIMQMQQMFTQQSQDAQGQAMQQFIAKLQAAATQVAKSKHLTLVLPLTSAVYADNSLDITADVEKVMH